MAKLVNAHYPIEDSEVGTRCSRCKKLVTDIWAEIRETGEENCPETEKDAERHQARLKELDLVDDSHTSTEANSV